MKRVTRILTTLAIVLAGPTAQAEVTGNMGWMSDYLFRGIPLSSSSAMLGLDWAQDEGGFYTGVWAANVDPGAELDFYGGYSGQVNEFGYAVGAIIYTFTDAFDETATEVNLSGSWQILSHSNSHKKFQHAHCQIHAARPEPDKSNRRLIITRD